MSALRLLLATDAVGGVWTYSLELARALRVHDVEAVLAVTGPPASEEQRAAACDLRLIETGLPLEWLDTGPTDIVNAGKALALIAAREGADVVQTSSAALLAGGAFEQPVIAVQHSCVATWWAAVKGTPLPFEFEWRRELVAWGLAKADAVVAPSKAFARATERVYELDRQLLAVHNGRTASTLRALPQGNFVFTAGRRWDEGKNLQTLDRAAARIDAPLQAAGPVIGPNGARVDLGHLSLLGKLSAAKAAGVLAARPIYASAALYEPFGLSVLEAAQAGCALVLSDIATHRELWDGAALFVDPQDDRGFAAAIAELLNDPEQRSRLGDSARRHACRYNAEGMAARMAGIYGRVTEPQLMAGAA